MFNLQEVLQQFEFHRVGLGEYLKHLIVCPPNRWSNYVQAILTLGYLKLCVH